MNGVEAKSIHTAYELVCTGLPAALRANPRRLYFRSGRGCFAQEYLGQLGRDETTAGIINPAKWEACQQDSELPTLPDHFAVVFGTSVDQAFGCVAVAWRDEKGRAVVGLMEYRPGTSWLPDVVNEIAEQYPRIPIGHDSKGPVVAEAEKVKQGRPRTVLHPQSWNNVQTGAALLVREVHTGNLIHFGQQPLTDSALTASRRGDERGFAFGRPAPDVQIVALETASQALRIYDETPVSAPRIGIVM